MILTLLALLNSHGAVAEPCSRPCAGESLYDAPEHALGQDQYLQSRLDWRSYYLNRLGGRQSGAPAGALGWPKPADPQRP